MAAPPQPPVSLRWRWTLAGIVLTTLLLIAVISVVDPQLERPAVSGLVGTVTLILAGIVIGRASSGETIVETGIAGTVVFLLVAAYLTAVRDVGVPGIVWVMGPFYAAMLAMIAAWVGEMIQGTVDDAHDDRRLDWPWVFVSVMCGLLIETYVLFLGEALLGLGGAHVIPILLVSVFLTGWAVGFFSPGFTAVEPALASLLLVVMSAALAELWLVEPLPWTSLALAAVGALVVGLAGGWLGEFTQSGPRALAFRKLVRGV